MWRASQELQERADQLTERVIEQRNEERDDAVQIISDAVNSCLDRNIDDILRDESL
jgi:signal recognition particle GTPase